tara:strand:+ start:723 stop:1139 length:417 start_codon:yes stop_codon:yes gene_type:complete
MTEDEKDAIKAFIDSLHPVSSDQWKERALVAEKHLFDLKNTVNVGKGFQCSVSNLHDNVAKLVFRWNESESLRNQLTEIDRKLNDVVYLMGSTPLERVERLVLWNKNIDSRNTELNKQVTELKSYFLNLSEEFVRKSL